MKASLLLVASNAALTACGGPERQEGFCAIPIDGSPVRGPADAPVTIVEFADFQCPYCADAEATLRRVEESRPSSVRRAFRHLPLPFHPYAWDAAVAAECAHEQGSFWPMARALFDQKGALYPDAIRQCAQVVGLDLQRFDRCLGSAEPKERVAADQKLALAVGVDGTPGFFINGQPLAGAQPLKVFLKVIDRAEAQWRASGLSSEEHYAELAARGCE